MLENNPLYKIYKSGKIPVMRYKNTGFDNYLQDDYFKDIKEHYGMQGCFALLGGMQNSYILSGCENVEQLNIGWVEPETKVFDLRTGKYKSAKEVFNYAFEKYEKEINEYPDINHINESRFDDFDLAFSQVIINGNKVHDIKSYSMKEQEQFLETILDGFFQIANGMDFLFLFKQNNDLEKYINFINEYGLFNELVEGLDLSDLMDLFGASIAAKEYDELYKENNMVRNIAKYICPKKSYEHFENKEKIKEYLKRYKNLYFDVYDNAFHTWRECGFMQGYVNVRIEENKLLIDFVKHGHKIAITPEMLLNNIVVLETVDKIINAAKDIGEIIPKFEIKQPIEYNYIHNLNQFYNKNRDNIEINDEGFKYKIDGFEIEYNFKLDDSVIKCENETLLTEEEKFNETFFHEEDIILRFNRRDILNIIEDFRKCIQSEKEIENIR